MTRVKIGNKDYYCIKEFMRLNNLKTRKSVYDWLAENKAERKKIGNNAFFSRL
jgi:hypothetical protein